jgi:hypothetical protein
MGDNALHPDGAHGHLHAVVDDAAVATAQDVVSLACMIWVQSTRNRRLLPLAYVR